MSTCEQWQRSIRVATPSRIEADSGLSLAEFVSKVTPWSTSSRAGGGGGGGAGAGAGLSPPPKRKLRSRPNVSGCSMAVRLKVDTLTLIAEAFERSASLFV